MKSRSPSANQDWTAIEHGILELILSKLSFINTIRFYAVCRVWHSVAQSYLKSPRYVPYPRQLPWLFQRHVGDFLRHHSRDLTADASTLRFYDLESQKTYKIKKHPLIGEKTGAFCKGSSYGWLILFDHNGTIPYLVNPFSQERMRLPPTRSNHRSSKVILLSDPSRHKNVIAVLMDEQKNNRYYTQISFYKIGGEKQYWTNIIGEARYEDMIRRNDRMFCALTGHMTLEVWDFCHGGGAGAPPTRIMRIEANSDIRDMMQREGQTYPYLVESLSDNILLVFVDHTTKRSGYMYELDMNKEIWVPVDSLGGKILFMNSDQSKLVSTNHLFPTTASSQEHDFIHVSFNLKHRLISGMENGVFSLQDENVTAHNPFNLPNWRLWITPTW